MINFTANVSSGKVQLKSAYSINPAYINPNNVTYIEQGQENSSVHFTDGSAIKVKGSIDEITKTIRNPQNPLNVSQIDYMA